MMYVQTDNLFVEQTTGYQGWKSNTFWSVYNNETAVEILSYKNLTNL